MGVAEPMAPTDTTTAGLIAAGRFIDGLAARDLDAVAGALAEDARCRALLPRRVLDLAGRPAFRAALDIWFAGAERWELVEAVVGEPVDGLIHLRWRVRLRKPDLGPGAFVVEQQAYAEADADGLLRDVAILCTGFRPEPS